MRRRSEHACRRCQSVDTRIVIDRANALRVCASFLLVPFYLFGGLAGDHRGPILPLERHCAACGHRFRGRSVIDCLTLRRPGSRRDDSPGSPSARRP